MAVSSREEMLADIRRALRRDGNTAPTPPDILASTSRQPVVSEIRDNYERQRNKLIERFETELIRIGVRFSRAANADAAFLYIEDVCRAREAKTIVGWQSKITVDVGLRERFEQAGIDFFTETRGREFIRTVETADIGISGVDYALADTGTLVLLSGKGQARSISLLPPLHVAIVRPEQILPGLSDLFPLLGADSESLSSAITFITGASRTADIELTLVVGVHGPQQLHVVLLD